MSKIIVSAKASTVREFAVANGLAQPGRGRLSRKAVGEFNRTHGLKYVPNTPKTIKVTAKPDKGRAVTRTVVVSEVRQWAVANGLAQPGRGRLSDAAKKAYVLAH